MFAQGTMRRRAIAAAIVLAALSGVALRAQQQLVDPATPSDRTNPIRPGDPLNRQGRQITLRDQLRVGLKAVTKGDFAFIDLVVLRVNQGVLSRSLVDGTFLWARRKVETQRPEYRKRPMVYFQPGLVMRAKAAGVIL